MRKLIDDYNENAKYLARFFTDSPIYNAKDVEDFLKQNYADIKWTGKVFCSGSTTNRKNLEESYIGPGGTYSNIGVIEKFEDHIISENARCEAYEFFYIENGSKNSMLFQISNCGFFKLKDDKKIEQNLTDKWQEMLTARYKEQAISIIKAFDKMCFEDLANYIKSIDKKINSLTFERDMLADEIKKLISKEQRLETQLNIDNSENKEKGE